MMAVTPLPHDLALALCKISRRCEAGSAWSDGAAQGGRVVPTLSKISRSCDYYYEKLLPSL
jgi:hypothetical protein|eukprot:COSAG01_NODE_58010_length_308_cov_4.655502_1_plen_61_part_00